MAASLWIELGAPYEVARVRAEIGTACHALGDADEHDVVERQAARDVGPIDAQRAVGAEHLTHGAAMHHPDVALPDGEVGVLVVLADRGAAVLVVRVAGHDDLRALEPRRARGGTGARGDERGEQRKGDEGEETWLHGGRVSQGGRRVT